MASHTHRLGGIRPDLLLLHRPPLRDRHLDAPAADAAQCARAREQWRGLELLYARGETRAIGVSNYCIRLLRCLLGGARVRPAVWQQMQHVGMGDDPFGYVSWARAHNIVYMAYSVLGGVQARAAKHAIISHETVRRIGAAHAISGAAVAMQWVVQLQLPLVTLTSSIAHAAANLRLFQSGGTSLRLDEMQELSALRLPGTPSHWGQCRDSAADPLPASTEAQPLQRHHAVHAGEEEFLPSVNVTLRRLDEAAATFEDCERCRRMPRRGRARSCWRCEQIERMRAALLQMSVVRAPVAARWSPIEGRSAAEILQKHPDPLGALRRGDVPAIIIRGLASRAQLRRLTGRLSAFASRFSRCMPPGGSCSTGWNMACAANCTAAAASCTACDEATEPRGSDRCALHFAAESSSPGASSGERRRATAMAVSQCAARHSEWGGSLKWGAKTVAAAGCFAARPSERLRCMDAQAAFHRALQLLGGGGGANGARAREPATSREIATSREMDVGTLGERELRPRAPGQNATSTLPQTPHEWVLEAVRSLSRRPDGRQRRVSSAREATGEHYAPGIMHAMRAGFKYKLHFDSNHADAWVALRQLVCSEETRREAEYTPGMPSSFAPLQHEFATAAIFTLSAPDRALNPADLVVRRTRWQAMAFDCKLTQEPSEAYGVGVRMARLDAQRKRLWDLDAGKVSIRGDPGDLYLFNSEFLHDTPPIQGSQGRTVVNARIGFSDGSERIDVWS